MVSLVSLSSCGRYVSLLLVYKCTTSFGESGESGESVFLFEGGESNTFR